MEAQSLRLVLWDDRNLDDLAAWLVEEGALVSVEVERLSRAECMLRMAAGLADAALVPSVSVLSRAEDYDVYPSVAISSWCSPTARVLLRHGFTATTATVACDARFGQEAFMARIVLKEHYGMEPAFLPVEPATRESLLASHADAILFAGEGDAVSVAGDSGEVLLDLGQEWFEFTNYPMVWGLFVARRGEADGRIVRLLRAAAADLQEADATIEDLVEDETIRFRFDEMATAGLTELGDILFFYHVTEDVPQLHFAPDPDADPESAVESDDEGDDNN